MFNLVWPWVLLLLPLPWLIMRFAPTEVKTGSESLSNTSLPLLASDQYQQQNHSYRYFLNWGLWLLILLALARPVWLSDEVQPITEQGRDVMLAVDLSGSMEIKDMQLDGDIVDRLSVVKKVLADFIEQRNGDRVGMILFADHAYLATPLSFDLNFLHTQVDELVHRLVGDMTAIGEAIGQGVKQLLSQPAEQRILILLTDGQNTSGEVEPIAAAKIAAKHHVKVYTIGVGADEMYQRTLFGKRKVNPSHDLDEESLKQVAQLTGGAYYRARNSEDLAEIYALINQLHPISDAEQYYRPQKELYFYPLALMIISLMLVMALRCFSHWHGGREK